MSFSYTEKKRVRRSFEKISSVMELPNLLATQVQSYDAFLQRYVDSDKRLNAGLEQVVACLLSDNKEAREKIVEYFRFISNGEIPNSWL